MACVLTFLGTGFSQCIKKRSMSTTQEVEINIRLIYCRFDFLNKSFLARGTYIFTSNGNYEQEVQIIHKLKKLPTTAPSFCFISIPYSAI